MQKASATPSMSEQAKQIFMAHRQGKTAQQMINIGIAKSIAHIEFVLEQMRVFAII